MSSTTQAAAQHSTAPTKIPARLLDLSAPPEFTLAISERNKKESPLLAFPSEILNKILQEVVADQTVHVLPEGGRKYKTRICASPEDCPTSESPRIHLARDDNAVSDGMEDDSCYTTRHKECEDNGITKSGLNLDVLLVCRQIYREASLLPFQKNTFVFGLHPLSEGPRLTMAGFVNRLKREQRKAIQHVIIASNDIHIPSVKSQLGQLRGLRSLHMLLAPGLDVFDFHEVLGNCYYFATTYCMGWLPLRNFRISMEGYLDRRSLDALSCQAAEIDRLVRGIEAKFLRLNSKTAEAKTALPAVEDVAIEDDVDESSSRIMEMSNEANDLLDW
jgi:hypothetical protein